MAAIVTRLLDDDGTPLPATVAARLDRVVMQMSREWDIEDDMTYTAVRDALTAAMGYTMRQIAGAPIGAGVTP
jgi:tryptophan 2,3-dioxygenase